MHAAIPLVEVADDAHALRIGGPDGEVHAGDAADRHHMRPELVPRAMMRALAEEVQVVLGQHRTELVRVHDLAGRAVLVDAEGIGQVGRGAGQWNPRLEETIGMTQRHGRHQARCDQLHGRGRRLHRPQHHRRATIDGDRMTPEHRKGITAAPRGDGRDEVVVGCVDGAAHGEIVSRRGDIL